MSNQQQNAFQLTIDEAQIAWLGIDVANESVNVLQAQFVDDLQAILTQITTNEAKVKGLIIHSLKADNFIAGADIHMLAACESAVQAQELARQGQKIFQQLADLPFPVVAAIHGACLGGGFELALACDYRVCSEASVTQLGLPEVKLGLLPGSGGTQRLPRLIGVLAALDLILTGRTLRAKQASRLGLVDACVPQSILLEVAQQWITQPPNRKKSLGFQVKEWLLTRNSWGRNWVFDQASLKAQRKAKGKYPAIRAILDVMKQGLAQGMEAGLAEEALRFGQLVITAESAALRSLFFAGTELKKEQQNTDQEAQFKRVAVLGAGLMGAGISHVSVVNAKASVRIKDINNDQIVKALRQHDALCRQRGKKQRLSVGEAQKSRTLLSGATDFSGFAGRDLVIEAVFEDLALKQQMVRESEQQTTPDCIFATNTSSLPIHQIAEQAQRPENIIGLHYFSPVEKMPLVEVIPHSATAPQTVNRILSFARAQGKTPIVVKDKAGFYVNRILVPYINQALHLLLEGEPVEHIDDALVNFGFPVGPLRLLDEVGIDIGAKITPILVKELGESFKAPETAEILLAAGRKGRKTGKGFYLYSTGKKGRNLNKSCVDMELYRLLKIKPEAKRSEQEIVRRCLLPMLNETVRCLDEQVIACPRDADIGAVYGLGFPPFLGGPCHYMDKVGLTNVVDWMNESVAKYGSIFAPCEGLLNRAGQQQPFYPKSPSTKST